MRSPDVVVRRGRGAGAAGHECAEALAERIQMRTWPTPTRPAVVPGPLARLKNAWAEMRFGYDRRMPWWPLGGRDFFAACRLFVAEVRLQLAQYPRYVRTILEPTGPAAESASTHPAEQPSS